MIGKCVCIKSYFNNPNSIIFHKDEIYEYTDQKFVTREMPDGYNVKFSKGEYIYFRKHQDVLAISGYGLFSTYFKTLKEIRKEKIEKIEK